MNELESKAAGQGSQVVYVVQQNGSSQDDGLNLVSLLGAIRRYRWWVIGLTLLGTLGAVAYALTAQPVFLAESVLYPRESRTAGGLSSRLSRGLVGLDRSGGPSGRLTCSSELPACLPLEGVRRVVSVSAETSERRSIPPGCSARRRARGNGPFQPRHVSVFDKRTGLVSRRACRSA